MIIWLLTLVLFGCLGLAGWSFGVIRATFSFVGLMAGLVAAKLFGHLLDKPLGGIGVKNPAWLWVLGPFLVFLITLTIVKIAGFMVNNKVELYYKYKGGDLRSSLWSRLSQRLGLCVGMLNAAVYLVLISLVIYVTSYATFQMVQGDQTTWYVKLVNMAGSELKSTGLNKVAAAIDPVPENFYGVADLVGLLYHNDLLEGRLARYPGFLALGEQPEFQAIATDKDFTELRQRQPPISEILNNPKIQPFTTPEKLKELWDLVVPNLKDLNQFLATGKSDFYDGQKILGRWDVNLAASLSAARDLKPNMTTTEMRHLRSDMTMQFAKTVLIATPEKKAFFKNFGKLKVVPAPPGANPPPAATPPPVQQQAGGRGGRRGGGQQPPARGAAPPATRGVAPAAAPATIVVPDYQNYAGQWTADGANYVFSFSTLGAGPFAGTIEGERLTLTDGQYQMVFNKE